MRVIMKQHSVGQGGFFTGKIAYQACENIDSGNKGTSKRRRNSKTKKHDSAFRFVYDCGSRNETALEKEINNVFDENETIDLLFISHFDYDHVNGIKHLLNQCHVEAVALPYLEDCEKILFTAKSIQGANSVQSKFAVELIWDAERLLKETGNGIKKLIRIRYRNEGEADLTKKEPTDDLKFDNLKDIFEEHNIENDRWEKRKHLQIKTSYRKATRKPKSKKVKVYDVTADQAESMIWYIDDMLTKKRFLLIPHVHPYCSVCLKEFSSDLKETIKRHYKNSSTNSQPLVDYGKYIIDNIECKKFRTKLKKKYNTICPDHNLISMTLYAGPEELDTKFFLTGRSVFHCIQNGGFLLTGDASFSDSHNFKVGICGRCGIGFSDERRRDRFLEKYRECRDLVGAFMVPHHGSNYNFDFSAIEPFTELVTSYAAVGPNEYNHPGFWTRLEASRHPKAKFETVETISSLAMQIFSIENHYDLVDCLQKLLGRSPKTPLHYASERGRLARVKKLLERGADVESRDPFKMSPLHYAAMSGSSACLAAIIQALIKIRKGNKKNYTNAEVKISVNSGGIYKRRPLHFAAISGDQSSIDLLLKHKAWLGVNDYFKRTPLHYAAMSKNLANIGVLIRDKKHVNYGDVNGMTPLHYAVECRNVNSVLTLICGGADIEATNGVNQSSLYSAFRDEDNKFIENLICCGVDAKIIESALNNDKKLEDFDPVLDVKILRAEHKQGK